MIKPQYLLLAVLFWNVITFAVYGIDKHKATYNKHRISEKSLLLCAFFMGGLGAFLGMSVFRHKTKHMKFKFLVPLSILINVGVVILIYYKEVQIWLGSI